jgi:hypothetical protein
MNAEPKELRNRVVILNGFSDQEIMVIMTAVKALYADVDGERFHAFIEAAKQLPEAGSYGTQLLDLVAYAHGLDGMQATSTRDLIFAKTTANSIKMRLQDLIVDMSQDHAYLQENPPGSPGNPATPPNGSSAADGETE